MERLRDYDVDFIRAIACVRFTDLVGECSRVRSEIVVGSSVVGCRRDDITISQYVYGAAIKRAPFQLYFMAGSLGLHTRLERNGRPASASLPIEEGILLRSAVNDHAPIRPRMEKQARNRLAVVVIARIFRYDAGVRLPW